MHPFPTADNPPVAAERNEQLPLGDNPSYDDVLDVAVQYTFPASDPIAVDACCADIDARQHREEGRPQGPDATPGHGEAINL